MSVVVVAAHPDDEALGCAGAMARLSAAGETVHVIFVAEGEGARGQGADDVARTIRREDMARAACHILGAQEPVFLRLPDNRLDTVALLEVVQKIEAVAAPLRPHTIFTHHRGDLNIDHEIVSRACLTAFRPQPGSTVRAIYGFEVLSSTGWNSPETGFQPAHFIDISAHTGQKRDALHAYDAEMRAAPHARSYRATEALWTLRGAQVGLDAAEAFTVLRQIVA
jgi:N-acetylglucosamine malate deacetylase 1